MGKIAESDRLLIRTFALTDTEKAFTWFHDPDVMKYIPGGPDQTLEQAKARIERYISHYRKFGYSKYILMDNKTSGPIGDAGIMKLDGTEFIELGFRLHKDYWGKGLATEAAKAILKHSFEVIRLKIIHAVAEPENDVSNYIIEKKLKFDYLGKDIFWGIEMNLYSINYDKFKRMKYLAD